MKHFTGRQLAWAAAGLLALAPAGATAGDREARVAEGRRQFQVQGCHRCHRVAGTGTPMGPDLSHVGAKYSEAYLARWLSGPEAQRPSAHMPRLELDPAQIEALAAYLATLR